MRGHEPLIAMRLRRQKPSTYVAITVGQDCTWIGDNWHHWEGSGPFIDIGPHDHIERLDLRFLVGLGVLLTGDVADEVRVWRAFDACLRAGASRVIAGLTRECREGLATVESRDSKGVLSWRE